MNNMISRVFTITFMVITLFAVAQPDITIDQIWKEGRFYPSRVWGIQSMPNGAYYTTLQRSKNGIEVIKYSYKSGDSVSTIFSTASMESPVNISDYAFSSDEKKMLFTTEVENIYRHSTREHVYVVDLTSGKAKKVSVNGKQRYTTFSPKADKIAYVRGNNLYYQDLASGKETQVTTDGSFNHIINGATDWVYEEEFGFDKAFAWSPEGTHLAYYRFDESAVKEFNMVMYQHDLYPTDYKFKYPKAGEDNSKVTMHIYQLANAQVVKSDLDDYEYIPRIKWASNNALAVQTLNRLQNELNFQLVDAATGQATNIYSEQSDTYVEHVNYWYFLPGKSEMIITSEKSGYMHLVSINFSKKTTRDITSGSWDITRFYGMNIKTGMAYYQAAKESPTQREIYSVNLKSGKSYPLAAKNGWNDAAFSRDFSYFINTYSNANTPYYITVNNAKGKMLKVLEDNAELRAELEKYTIGRKEFTQFTTAQGTQLNAWMIKPANFDSTKQYPVFITIYGGPGSQTVKDEWDYNLMWHHMLAQKGYIVMSVDNRGTGARGVAFKKCTYQQLGKLEVEDYIETAKYLQNQNYVDGQRIGIWGWSYGGYMSTLAISKGADYFKTAIAVAPVTSWRYYDNIYTERYMRTPQENADGYDSNSPINHVGKIKGKYLLVHGTADDNVHFQNTAELVSALVKNDIQYDFYMYTDKNHSIYGGNTRKHLFTKFTNFIIENL